VRGLPRQGSAITCRGVSRDENRRALRRVPCRGQRKRRSRKRAVSGCTPAHPPAAGFPPHSGGGCIPTRFVQVARARGSQPASVVRASDGRAPMLLDISVDKNRRGLSESRRRCGSGKTETALELSGAAGNLAGNAPAKQPLYGQPSVGKRHERWMPFSSRAFSAVRRKGLPMAYRVAATGMHEGRLTVMARLRQGAPKRPERGRRRRCRRSACLRFCETATPPGEFPRRALPYPGAARRNRTGPGGYRKS